MDLHPRYSVIADGIQMQEVVGLCMENIVVSSSLPGKKSTHHAAMPHAYEKEAAHFTI
jgi:hypothetical protein